ncbi:MAG: Ig-like domain-containing protein, partial [Myxococcota bacterium]
VNVRQAVVVTIAVDQTEVSLQVGETVQLSAMGTYSDANVVDITDAARWDSSLSAVASVNSRGLVEARAPGQVVISASKDSSSATVPVTVVEAPAEPAP